MFKRVESVERLSDGSIFEWTRGRQYHIPEGMDGHLYAFETLTINLLRSGADWTDDEKLRAARTLIGVPVGVNHMYDPDPASNVCIDAEFWEGSVQGFVYVTDLFMNALYDLGQVSGVSVEYYPRFEDCDASGICVVAGNHFVGIDFVTKDKKMGDPTSKLIRVETIVEAKKLVANPSECSRVEAITDSETKVQKMRELLWAFSDLLSAFEVISKLFKETVDVIGLPEKVGAAKAPKTEVATEKAVEAADSLQMAQVEVKLAGMSTAIDNLKQRFEKLVTKEPRKETVFQTEGGEVDIIDPEETNPLSGDISNKLRLINAGRAKGRIL